MKAILIWIVVIFLLLFAVYLLAGCSSAVTSQKSRVVDIQHPARDASVTGATEQHRVRLEVRRSKPVDSVKPGIISVTRGDGQLIFRRPGL